MVQNDFKIEGETGMRCLDSDLLVAILRGEDRARSSLEKLDAENSATTAINAFEIYYGANHSLKKQENVEQAKRLLQRLSVIPFDERSSERAGILLSNLASNGEIIDYRDAMIAGIVIEAGLTLVTKNKKHFERIPKIKIEEW